MLQRFTVQDKGLSTKMLRRDAKYEKNYIAGRYGVVLGKICGISIAMRKIVRNNISL